MVGPAPKFPAGMGRWGRRSQSSANCDTKRRNVGGRSNDGTAVTTDAVGAARGTRRSAGGGGFRGGHPSLPPLGGRRVRRIISGSDGVHRRPVNRIKRPMGCQSGGAGGRWAANGRHRSAAPPFCGGRRGCRIDHGNQGADGAASMGGNNRLECIQRRGIRRGDRRGVADLNGANGQQQLQSPKLRRCRRLRRSRPFNEPRPASPRRAPLCTSRPLTNGPRDAGPPCRWRRWPLIAT